MTHPTESEFVPVSPLYGSVAQLLRFSAVVLALLFILRVLLSLAPLRTGLPAVTLRFCAALISQGPIAVLVVCLIALSLLIDEKCRASRRLARGLRAAALPLALAYLLLIPVYGTAQWWRTRSEAVALRQSLQSSLQQLRNTRQDVELAASTEQLQRIWATLPAGTPPLTRFGNTAGQQRATVIRFLDRVNGILLARQAGIDGRLIVVLVRDTGLFSLACLALAALFHRSSRLGLPARQRWIPGAGRTNSRRQWWRLGVGRLSMRRWWPLGAGRSGSRRRKTRRGPLDDEMAMLVQSTGLEKNDLSHPSLTREGR